MWTGEGYGYSTAVVAGETVVARGSGGTTVGVVGDGGWAGLAVGTSGASNLHYPYD